MGKCFQAEKECDWRRAENEKRSKTGQLWHNSSQKTEVRRKQWHDSREITPVTCQPMAGQVQHFYSPGFSDFCDLCGPTPNKLREYRRRLEATGKIPNIFGEKCWFVSLSDKAKHCKQDIKFSCSSQIRTGCRAHACVWRKAQCAIHTRLQTIRQVSNKLKRQQWWTPWQTSTKCI